MLRGIFTRREPNSFCRIILFSFVLFFFLFDQVVASFSIGWKMVDHWKVVGDISRGDKLKHCFGFFHQESSFLRQISLNWVSIQT